MPNKETNHFYRSLDDLANPPAMQERREREFLLPLPAGMDAFSRRQFLKLMGASMALAGAAGCRWPESEIAPFNGRPEGRIPGVPVQFATSMEVGGVSAGLLATSYDGRPIKIEGNPLHPTNRGATNAFQQASVLSLYDPDRSQWVRKGNAESGTQNPESHPTGNRLGWNDFLVATQPLFSGLRQKGGAGLYFLSEATSSPTMERLRRRLAEICPRHQWVEYEPISRDHEREGTRLVFGQPCRVDYDLTQAEKIVTLDADLLWTHPAGVQYARDFAAHRRADNGQMNRLYAFESVYSLTGGMADFRFPLRSGAILNVAVAMANQLGLGEGVDIALSNLANSAQFKAGFPHVPPWFEAMMRDLQAAQGKSVVAVGPRQPAVLHALAAVMNAALANAGQTVLYRPDLYPDRPPHPEALRQLAEDLRQNRVDTLVILGNNPIYAAPGELELDKLLLKAKTTVHLGLYNDETARRCTWHVPQAHYLESWADGRAWDGTLSLTQPLIEPLYQGKTSAELLAVILGEPAKAYDLVRQTIKARDKTGDFESRWQTILHNGLVPDSALAPLTAPPRLKPLADRLASVSLCGKLDPNQAEFELVFTPGTSTYDGRFANNAWLQELPDSLTKLTWDNALLLSASAAERLKLTNGDEVRVHKGKQHLDLPAYILPGQAAESLTVALGYGRNHAGRVGDAVGVDVYPLLGSDGAHILPSVRLEKTGKKYQLATTQDHHPINTLGGQEEQKRAAILIREADLAKYRSDPAFARTESDKLREANQQLSLFQEHDYTGYKWGMMIDLTACIGCSVCELACMAENNIPVVGKDEVARGREMHWIRIDRYFKGEPDTAQAAFQPVPCMQCENAPCEQVCPVAATVHDQEGLNAMVYNRCIGTRYCSNNCPYKVRRFNWFWNQKNVDGQPLTDVQKMVYNPAVTLRSRGVMEKCTYCVQRINHAKIEVKNKAVAELEAKRHSTELPADAKLPEKIAIPDGTLVPACTQACPTQAITFGDLNDPVAKVTQLAKSPRQYGILAELNVKARTNYLAKLRNTGEKTRKEEH